MFGLLLLNIYSSTIFFFIEKSEIWNFADYNAIYLCWKDLPKIKEDLISAMKIIEMV